MEVKDVFLYNTFVNDMECSLMTPEEADYMVYNKAFGDEIEFEFQGKKFIYKIDYDALSNLDSTSKYFNEDDYKTWEKSLYERIDFKIDVNKALDYIVDDIMDKWDIFDESTWIYEEDAKLKYDAEAEWFSIDYNPVSTVIRPELGREIIKSVIVSGRDSNLDNYKDFLVRAEVTDVSLELIHLMDELNNFIKSKVTAEYNGNNYDCWLGNYVDSIEIDYDNYTFKLNTESSLDDYVYYVSTRLDTKGKPIDFITHDGKEISITGGDWGWKMDQAKTKESLINAIETGSDTYEIKWLQSSHSIVPGTSYVEVDLTNQKIFYYKNGELIVSSGIVSGNANGHMTPKGVYKLKNKQRNAVLKGRNDDGSKYESPVNFWMPFNGGIGLHDASWRSKCGGTIYKTNGSHGCVNLPYDTAKKIFENIDYNTPIVCYWL